jgi:predicted transcriptional regulator
VLSIRLTPDVLEKVVELASQSRMSRNAFIESIVGEYVQGETSADETTAEGEDNGDE